MKKKTVKSLALGLTSVFLLYTCTQLKPQDEVQHDTSQPQDSVVTEQELPTPTIKEIDSLAIVMEHPLAESEGEPISEADSELAPTPQAEPVPALPSEPVPTPQVEPEPTPPSEPEPTPPTEPEPTPPSEPEPEIEPQPTTPCPSVLYPTEPAPSEGMHFVVGFGWVEKPGPAVTIEVDSTGDINKIIGIM